MTETVTVKSPFKRAVGKHVAAAAVGKFQIFDLFEVDPGTEFVGTPDFHAFAQVNEDDRRFARREGVCKTAQILGRIGYGPQRENRTFVGKQSDFLCRISGKEGDIEVLFVLTDQAVETFFGNRKGGFVEGVRRSGGVPVGKQKPERTVGFSQLEFRMIELQVSEFQLHQTVRSNGNLLLRPLPTVCARLTVKLPFKGVAFAFEGTETFVEAAPPGFLSILFLHAVIAVEVADSHAVGRDLDLAVNVKGKTFVAADDTVSHNTRAGMDHSALLLRFFDGFPVRQSRQRRSGTQRCQAAKQEKILQFHYIILFNF